MTSLIVWFLATARHAGLPVKFDGVSILARWYMQSAAPTPSHTQYGWARADFRAASGV